MGLKSTQHVSAGTVLLRAANSLRRRTSDTPHKETQATHEGRPRACQAQGHTRQQRQQGGQQARGEQDGWQRVQEVHEAGRATTGGRCNCEQAARAAAAVARPHPAPRRVASASLTLPCAPRHAPCDSQAQPLHQLLALTGLGARPWGRAAGCGARHGVMWCPRVVGHSDAPVPSGRGFSGRDIYSSCSCSFLKVALAVAICSGQQCGGCLKRNYRHSP